MKHPRKAPIVRAAAVALALLVAMLVACGGGGDTVEFTATTTASDTEETARALDAVNVATTSTEWGGVQIAVGGATLANLKAVRLGGVNVLPTILSAVDSGSAIVVSSETGVVLLVAMAPSKLGVVDGVPTEIETGDGVVVGAPADLSAVADVESSLLMRPLASSSAPKCTKLTFQKPTTLTNVNGCGYNGRSCANPARAHTGIDFGGSASVVAVADGTVVRIEKMSSSDHGMGNNVHVMHVHDCNVVYSSYSHLDSINSSLKKDAAIKRGAKIGKSGGSGYGRLDAWEKHLHVEMKTLAVSGNPKGVGKKNTSCQVDPKNAGPSMCWGYVDPKLGSDAYGYIDPGKYF